MAKDNQVWYEDIMRKGALRNSGMDEITEANPLDWQRLRILENGKLVPAMAKDHFGAPGVIDLDLLRDAAELKSAVLPEATEIHQPPEERGADSCAEKLGNHISAEVFGTEIPVGEIDTQRHCRVDVADRYAAYVITKAKKHEAETETDAEDSDRRAGQHGASASEEHQKHCAEKLS